MSQLMLRYHGNGPIPAEEVAKVKALVGVTIINNGLPRFLIVEASDDLAKQRLKRLPKWTLYLSHTVELDLFPPLPTPNNVAHLRLVKTTPLEPKE